MIEWKFYFNEGTVITQAHSQEEDANIRKALKVSNKPLYLPGEKLDIFVNLRHVKCITRQELQEIEELPKEEEASSSSTSIS